MHRGGTAAVVGVLLTLGQQVAADSASSCKDQSTCGACLTADPGCAWCRTEDFKRERCDRETVLLRFCAESDIVSPHQEVIPTENRPLSDATSTAALIQLEPQHVRVKLRPHQKYEFEVRFRQAEDYPLDLYYLMDLTYSQWDDKEMLVALGSHMIDTLRSLTKNFRVGFGSFVDKPVMPYVSQVPGVLENPCTLFHTRDCAPAYGFRNHLSLTSNVRRFIDEVRKARVSGNLDDLEGGMDALVQAVACADEVGWGKQSRKLVIYSTGGLFHLAGEGKLGGATKKNDLRCHLDNDGLYEQSTVQDYPSVEEVVHLLRNKSVNVVFAVTGEHIEEYKKLVKIMKAGVQTEKLSNDSSNILEVIDRQYQSITSTVELRDDAGKGVRVRYRSRCFGTELEERSNCTGIRTGDEVSFFVELEPVGCPKERNQVFRLKDVRTSETVRVELEVLCSCECESPQAVEMNSPKCSGVGQLQCGACVCPENRAGWRCECEEGEEDDSCRPEDSTSSEVCSGRGDCVCGKCECRSGGQPGRKVYGRHCQCDNFSCDRARDGSICGGKERGECECDRCVCRSGWSGDDCSCNNNTRQCEPVNNPSGLLCSGKGDCVCGRCHCYNTDQGRYAGLFCQDCPTCRGLCQTYQPCAQCLLRAEAGSNRTCEDSCPYVLSLKDELGPPERGTACRFEDDVDGCVYRFQYYSDVEGNNIIDVLRKKECNDVDVLAIVLGTVGSVVAIGLLTLLLWRLYTYLMDRREYARFEREVELAETSNAHNLNQLYESPITTYRVPAEVLSSLDDSE